VTSGAVWVTSSYPWPGEPVGGIFFRTQARAMARLGVPVTVVSPIPWAPWPLPLLRPHWRQYARSPRSQDDGAVHIARPRYPNVPGQPSLARPDRAIAAAVWGARREWSGAALVHGHYAVQGLAAWRIARRTHLPLVLTFHGDDMNAWPDQHPDRMADLRAATGRAAAVIGVSEAMVDRIRDVTGAEAIHLPIGIAHDAIDAHRLPRADARRRLRLPDDRIIALYVGSLQPLKGVREFADAILALGPPFLGVLVGDGPDAGYRSTAGGGVLDYRGQIPNEEVAAYLSAADVLVLPSHREGLPTILVEAGSVGVPVVASPVGGIPSLLADGRGRVLDSITAEAVVVALRELADDPAGAAARAARLGPYVREHYDADRNAARLLAIYRSVAPGSWPEAAGTDR